MEQLRRLQGHLGPEERHLHLLSNAGSFAYKQCRHDSQGKVHRAALVGYAGVRDFGAAARAAATVLCVPAVGLGNLVERRQRRHRAFRAPPGCLCVDEPCVASTERLVPEPPALHRARPEVLDYHIAVFGESQSDLRGARLLQIKRHGTLPTVERFPESAEAIWFFPHAAAEVASGGLFDLDHLGAKIAENDRRERALLISSEVEDADAFEWFGHGRQCTRDWRKFPWTYRQASTQPTPLSPLFDRSGPAPRRGRTRSACFELGKGLTDQPPRSKTAFTFHHAKP